MRKAWSIANPNKFGRNHVPACVSKFALIYTRSSGRHRTWLIPSKSFQNHHKQPKSLQILWCSKKKGRQISKDWSCIVIFLSKNVSEQKLHHCIQDISHKTCCNTVESCILLPHFRLCLVLKLMCQTLSVAGKGSRFLRSSVCSPQSTDIYQFAIKRDFVLNKIRKKAMLKLQTRRSRVDVNCIRASRVLYWTLILYGKRLFA
jgi:hypothetical protein